MSDLELCLGSYLVAVAITFALHANDARVSPKKGARYKALPWTYKALCYLGVLPWIGIMPIAPWGGAVALILFAFLEAAAIRWYERQGML